MFPAFHLIITVISVVQLQLGATLRLGLDRKGDKQKGDRKKQATPCRPVVQHDLSYTGEKKVCAGTDDDDG